jgi:hypothetical protein
MAILNDVNSYKYMLVEPILVGRNGNSKTLKKRIIRVNHSKTSNVVDYFQNFLEVITYLCLEVGMYSARVNPDSFELRGYAHNRYINTATLNPSQIQVKVCSKAKPMNNKQIEFVIDEDMFDNYLEGKPILNPQYVYKKEPWIVQIFKGSQVKTQPQIELVVDEPQVINAEVQSNFEVFSVAALSQKLFKNFMPCDINAISLSKADNLALDIQVVQFSIDQDNTYTYIPVSSEMLTTLEYDFLNQLRVFKEQNPNNTLSVFNDGFSQEEFIQTVEFEETPVESKELINDLDIVLDTVITEPIPMIFEFKPEPDPIVSKVASIEVFKRNDMSSKFFAAYQPCVVTSVEFSNIPGNLYSVKLINRASNGNDNLLTILIPTNSVHDKDKNFFTEFENKLKRNQYVRIINNHISFVNNTSLDFVDDYVEPITAKPVTTKASSKVESVEIKTNQQIEMISVSVDITIDNIDDQEDIMFEPLPKPKEKLTAKEVIKNFFYNTFKASPQDQVLTFALQNEGRNIVLHQDDIIYPCGKKILYGCKFLEFDSRIREIIKLCISKKIHFYNIDSTLVGKIYDDDGVLIDTRTFMSLI